MLAAGIRYGMLKTWDFPTRKEQFSIKGHESDVWSLTFSPDGRTLISGDGDWNKPGQVKLWDAATLKLRRTLPTSGEVLSVACSSDGQTIAAGCGDGTVKAWTVDQPHNGYGK
jgi:WD40 repeat protein